MRKENLPKFKVIWEQVFPKDAELRIQRAFEMLLDKEFNLPSTNQLKTTIDKHLKNLHNESDEKEVTHFRRSSRKVKGIPEIRPKVFEGKKAQRL